MNNKTKKPSITIAIPARNETKELSNTLKKLTNLSYEKLEVLVLDDCSQDKTSQIIKDFAHKGVRFIEGRAPKEPWIGRNYAIKQLAEQASGKYILFTDADNPIDDDLINFALKEIDTKDSLLINEGSNTYINFISQSFFQPWMLMFNSPVFKGYKKHHKVSSWLVNSKAVGKLLDGDLSVGVFGNSRNHPGFISVLHQQLEDDLDYDMSTTRQSLVPHFIPNKYFVIKKNHNYFVRAIYPSHSRSTSATLVSAVILSIISLLSLGVSIAAVIHGSFYVVLALVFNLLLVAEMDFAQVFDDGKNPLSKKIAMLLIRSMTLPFNGLYCAWLCIESVYRYKTGKVTWRGRNICFPTDIPLRFKNTK